MTTWDMVFVALAVLDLLAVGLIAAAAIGMAKRGGVAFQRLQPGITHGSHLVQEGTSLAKSAATHGKAIFEDVKATAQTVGRRVSTTRHLVEEVIHPDPDASPQAIAAEVRESLQVARRQAEQGQEWIDRVNRLRRAAARAAKAPPRR
jgi:hypothetical protein